MKDITAVHFKTGDVIFKEGDPPGGVYLINQGAVKVTKNRAGEMIELATLGWNSIFGEMALIDRKPRSATVTATKDTWCYLVDEQAFQQKIDDLDPFMRGICQVLVRIARTMTEKYPADVERLQDALAAASVVPGDDALIDERGKPIPRTHLPMADVDSRKKK